jgi:hypothetical protein
MNTEEEKELERRRMTEEVRMAVESELKKRYSWIGLIVAVIMSSVITLTVREILTPARVQMGIMETLQTRAMEQLNDTSIQSEKLNTQFEDLWQKSEKIRENLVEATENNLGFTDDLHAKMAALSSVVSSLNANVNKLIAKEPERQTYGKLQPKINTINKDLELSREKIKVTQEAFKTAQEPLSYKR